MVKITIDTNKIAEILKNNRGKKSGTYTHYLHNEFVDLFKKETRKMNGRPQRKDKIYYDDFNPKQFLKKAGVE